MQLLRGPIGNCRYGLNSTFPTDLGFICAMPKLPIYAVCFDEVKQVSISHLTSLGYLRPDAKVVGPMSWSIGGEPSGSITVEANLPKRYVELRYVCDGTPINYRVRLESVKKNFGGHEWYFICPVTGRRCKKLYHIDGYFLSRYAYPWAMYSSQKHSKSVRAMFAEYFVLDKADQFLSKPYSRTHYKGKITKRYARLLRHERRVLMNSAVLRRSFL